MTKWFWENASGLKADIKRHRERETELMQKIAELESSLKNDTSEMTNRSLVAYRHFLAQLQQSKAEVTSQIGKIK